MTPDEFRAVGHRLVDWIADYRARVGELPVHASVEPGEVRARLPRSAPEEPESFDAIVGDLETILMPGLSHWQHPSFFGYFPSNAELSSVLGDFLSTGLGVLGLSWQSSPALTELEETVVDWLRRLVGLSDAWEGVIQDTASSCTLNALVCARERATDYSLARGGLRSAAAPLVVYASSQAHSSVDKAALLAGYGRDNVRHVPVDERFAMRADRFEEMVRVDLEAGLLPCAVVATTGTTATTAVDPIADIAEVAERRRLWLHVDSAMAGSAMILPECRAMWDGIERADSIVLNPHKWLGAAFDCSVQFVRDSEHLVRVMSTNPSYLRSAVDRRVKNFRDWGVPLGRRFRALKLWCLLREQGAERLRARLRRDLDNARFLTELVAAAPPWRLLAPVPLQTLCIRHEPPGLSPEELDRHTLRWVEAVNRSGKAYLTAAQLEGRWMARVSIGAILTERSHVEALWRLLQTAVTA